MGVLGDTSVCQDKSSHPLWQFTKSFSLTAALWLPRLSASSEWSLYSFLSDWFKPVSPQHKRGQRGQHCEHLTNEPFYSCYPNTLLLLQTFTTKDKSHQHLSKKLLARTSELFKSSSPQLYPGLVCCCLVTLMHLSFALLLPLETISFHVPFWPVPLSQAGFYIYKFILQPDALCMLFIGKEICSNSHFPELNLILIAVFN